MRKSALRTYILASTFLASGMAHAVWKIGESLPWIKDLTQDVHSWSSSGDQTPSSNSSDQDASLSDQALPSDWVEVEIATSLVNAEEPSTSHDPSQDWVAIDITPIPILKPWPLPPPEISQEILEESCARENQSETTHSEKREISPSPILFPEDRGQEKSEKPTSSSSLQITPVAQAIEPFQTTLEAEDLFEEMGSSIGEALLEAESSGGTLHDIQQVGFVAQEEKDEAILVKPLVDNSFVQESFASQMLYHQMMGERLTHYRLARRGYSAGECTIPFNYWMKGYGEYARQRVREGDIPGSYHSYTSAWALGRDKALERGLIGASFGFARFHIHHTSPAYATTHANSYQVALYGEWDEAAWYTRWMVSYAYNQYHTDRRFFSGSLSLVGEDRFNGWQAGAYGEIGYDYPCHAWYVTPALGLYYAHLTLQSYTQSGLDTANQTVNGSHYNRIRPVLGIRLTYRESDIWQPEVHARIFYNIKNDRMRMTSTFGEGGSSFVTESFLPHATGYNVGASVTRVGCSPWIWSLSYDVEKRGRYLLQAGFLSLRYVF